MELSLITIAASDSAWNSNEVVILLLRETFMYVGVDPHEMNLICADDNTDFIHVCIFLCLRSAFVIYCVVFG